MILIAFISPLSGVFISEYVGSYLSPHSFWKFQNLYTIVFMCLTNGLIFSFWYLSQTNLTKNTFVITGIVITLVTALFIYPQIYDTIYYFSAVKLWLLQGINPYTELYKYLSSNPFPYVHFPLYHNYPYGSSWLLFTAIIAYAGKYTYLYFNTLLSLTSIVFLVGSFFIINRSENHPQTTKAAIWILLNPITIIFLVRSGNPESLILFLLLIALNLIKSQKYLLSSIPLTLILFIKQSSIPLVMIIYIWILIQVFKENRHKFLCSVCMFIPPLTAAIITAITFHTVKGYFIGGTEIINAIQQSGVSLQTMLGYLTAGIIPVPYLTLVSLYSSLSLIIFVLIILIISLSLLKSKQSIQQLYFIVWVISFLSIYLLGSGSKPWYLIIPLVISLFLSTFKQNFSLLIVLLSFIGDYFYSVLEVSQPISIIALIINVMFKELIPLLLIVYSINHDSYTPLTSFIQKIVSQIIPTTKPISIS